MSGGSGAGTVQVRPLVAFVLLAALAALMMTGALNAGPRRVITPGSTPDQVSATTAGEVILGQRLTMAAASMAPPVTAALSASGQPVLVVHPIAQPVGTTPTPTAVTNGSTATTTPASAPAPAGIPGSSTSSNPTAATQLQPARPGKHQHKHGHKRPRTQARPSTATATATTSGHGHGKGKGHGHKAKG